jgi:ADP-ribosyl-[dinitrogen reductase] hydrolase
MIGAILGDIVGSRFEFTPKGKRNKSEDFQFITSDCFFTDDTAMTIATADAILNNKDFALVYKEWGRKYPNLGYGSNFRSWLEGDSCEPYNSYGNGSAMRVSPVGWLFNDLETVMDKAEESSSVTHNHIEGIKGAVSVAVCIYLARNKTSKKIIKEFIETYFGYDLDRTIAEIRPNYRFDVSCQGSVPESIICFLESTSVVDAIRKAVSLGGDTDTQACIAGSIAEAHYNYIPICNIERVEEILPDDMNNVYEQFIKRLYES